MALDIGDKAPDFTLATDTGEPASLKALKGQNVVLYFYPRDDTPGCTKEAINFSAAKTKFTKTNTVVVGVSKDSVAAHGKFRTKHDLKVELGSDPDGATIEAYGAWVEKSMYGKKYMGIDRSTILIDSKGKIAQIWRKVKVEGHVEAVLEAVKAL